jgi:hypothetical protein
MVLAKDGSITRDVKGASLPAPGSEATAFCTPKQGMGSGSPTPHSGTTNKAN